MIDYILPQGTQGFSQGTQGIIGILPQGTQGLLKGKTRKSLGLNIISLIKKLCEPCANPCVPCGKTLLLIFLLFSISCGTKKQEAVQKETVSDKYYTCSMHPQIMEKQPGKCPICGMELIVIQKTAASSLGEIKLSDQQILLGNIHTDTIKNGVIGDELALTGTLNFNQNKTSSYSSRVAGRIEKLYFKTMGDYIKKGDKLFDMYSEDLNSAKQEYLTAKEQKAKLGNSNIGGVNYDNLITSSKNKLLLWGMSESQIITLAKNNSSMHSTTFYSNTSGFVTSMDVKEGDYLMEGGTIVKLADIDNLWVEAQVYTSQLSYINSNAQAIVQIIDMPEKELKGTIEFINPEINADTRINLIRVSIRNVNHLLKPGMPAYVFIKNPKHKTLTLPTDAILRNTNSSIVWVQTGKNEFKSKMVETGLEENGLVEIKSGLTEGEVIVTSGAYLINSEYIFKNGTDPMAGMKM